MQLDLYPLAFWLWMATFVVWAIGSIVAKQTIGSYSDWQSRAVVWIVAQLAFAPDCVVPQA